MINIKELKLGTRVSFNKQYTRVTNHRNFSRDKAWVEYDCGELTGIVVGIRTIADGFTDYDSESGYHFIPKTYKKTILVVVNLKENIKKVPLDSISILPPV